MKEIPAVDLIAFAGYEWICSECEALNSEIEANETVVCDSCKKVFNTNPPESPKAENNGMKIELWEIVIVGVILAMGIFIIQGIK